MRNVMLSSKQKAVYDILLTQIVSNKASNAIVMKDGCIISPQKYVGGEDSDMSDIAVEFYKIIYGFDEILTAEGSFVDNAFAGDTMHSFNSVANITDGAGNKKAERTDISCWPKYLQDYYHFYHCLANFWIIPMSLGRTGTKLNRYDDPYLFLNNMNADILCDYSSRFCDFANQHYLSSIVNTTKKDMYEKKLSEEIVHTFTENIKKRALEIAQSNACEELYDLFVNSGIIDKQSFDRNT